MKIHFDGTNIKGAPSCVQLHMTTSFIFFHNNTYTQWYSTGWYINGAVIF